MLDAEVAAGDATGGVRGLAQVGDHTLEGLGERSDLVAAADVEVLLEVALGDRIGGADHASDRAGRGDEEGEEEVGGADAQADRDVGAACDGAQVVDADAEQAVERGASCICSAAALEIASLPKSVAAVPSGPRLTARVSSRLSAALEPEISARGPVSVFFSWGADVSA
jgi:hypothetical protein